MTEVPKWFSEGWPDGGLRGSKLDCIFKCPYGHPAQKVTGIEIDSFLIKSNHIHLGEPLGE